MQDDVKVKDDDEVLTDASVGLLSDLQVLRELRGRGIATAEALEAHRNRQTTAVIAAHARRTGLSQLSAGQAVMVAAACYLLQEELPTEQISAAWDRAREAGLC